ncbi:MAR1 protein, partial [Asarcornis scutulata]|nr:MAR1 protein [Asarcornis scutulata]
MPRRNHHPDGNFFRGKGHSYLALEEGLGIGIFILVLAMLFIFGCWYYKRRSGCKSLRVSTAASHFLFSFTFPVFLLDLSQSKSTSMGTIRTMVGEGRIVDCKMALQEYRNLDSVV